jgi:3-carboxy-cis,cis-muconate cycloisomerase
MAGRTWLQQATPITFGLKAAGWLDMLGRCRVRLNVAVDDALVLQFGGASGTLAALGDDAMRVAEAFAARLALALPEMPWQTQRDRLAAVAAALGILCGALGKIGRDLVLLAQSEVREVFETPSAGRGGSSTMPHKSNPVGAVSAVSAAIRAPALVSTMLSGMTQEHERAAGGWQAEWATLPELWRVGSVAAEAIAQAVGNLTVDPARMRENLTQHGHGIMSEALFVALSDHLPRRNAMGVAERLSREAERTRRSLRDVAAEDLDIGGNFAVNELADRLTPDNYLGASQRFIDRVLARWAP